MRNIYLKTKSLSEAIECFDKALLSFYRKRDTEIISTREALGRVSSKPVFARRSSPSFHSCAMDGIMVRSEDTKRAREHEPLLLRRDQYAFCDTGDQLFSPFDSVIMIEDLVESEEGMRIYRPVHPWEHVRPMGEDIIEKDLLYTGEHLFSPVELSVMLAAGVREVEVYKKPQLALIPTGDEMVSGEDEPIDGQIIESNTAMFCAVASLSGAEVKRYGIVKDDREGLKAQIQEAVKNCDVVIVLAGSSAGRDDLTASVAADLGEVLVHGISIRPGKPAILALLEGKPLIGLPGYPVSGYIIFDEIVMPLLRKKAHLPPEEKVRLEGRLTRRVVSSLQHQDYIRVKVGHIAGDYTVTPMERGAGASFSLSQSDGFVVVPQNSEGFLRGERVEVRLHRPLRNLGKRLVSIGSHDMVLDLINDLFAKQGKENLLISSHVGSLAGLQSLKDRECHLAPSHLLGEDGSYNLEALNFFSSGEKLALIHVVGRRQGILLPKGNPKGIRSLQDLRGKSMINRQRGAGTRILFDYLLRQEGISSTELPGYEREATTHLAVALAVKEGDVDFGIGIEAAALKMDCDFLYLADEDYEFVCYEEDLDREEWRELIDLLQSEDYRRSVAELGGYDTSRSGGVRIHER